MQGDIDDVYEIKQDFNVQLPDVSIFDYGPIEEHGALDSFSISSSAESIEIPETVEDDIWAFSRPDVNAQPCVSFKSWERFYDKSFQEPRTIYISEGGPCVFDAAIATLAKSTPDGEGDLEPGRVIQSASLLASLLQLGLGRESVLYRFHEESQSFYPLIKDGRMSGYTFEAFRSLSSTFVSYGNETRRIQKFIQRTQASTGSFASLIALASSMSDELARMHAQLGVPSTPVRSLLQLESRFERPGVVLNSLCDILRTIEHATTDEDLLSKLFGTIQGSEHTASWLRPTILRILTTTSKPWLGSVSSWLGLKVDPNLPIQQRNQALGFVKLNEKAHKAEDNRSSKELDYEFESSSMPSFITDEDAKLVFETGRSLRLLEAHKPEHPLLELSTTKTMATPGLEWKFSWKDIERIQIQAEEYRLSLENAIKDFDFHGRKRRVQHLECENSRLEESENTNSLSEEVAKAYIRASISTVEKPLTELKTNERRLLSPASFPDINDSPEEIFAPPMSLVPMISFNPLISTQAYLTNRACLRLLFRDYGLRSHFTLLHRFCLLGDGVFSSRLSHALFDPEIQTAERRKGHSRAGTSGLKLGSRDTWPPASSELRLALMGILTECYHQNGRSEGASFMFRNELPGGLSFSIRGMSEEELKRCMNPDSIEALDFLKVDYKPPTPLDAVITPASILKYDVIFKLLLRAIRMLFVVNQLFRDLTGRYMANRMNVDLLLQSFRIKSHHFVTTMCAYFFDGVQANWIILLRKLEDVEKRLDQEATDSLSSLQEFHVIVLDRIISALILRKRQAQVKELLEEIFSLVLQFARYLRLENAASDEAEKLVHKMELSATCEQFEKKVRLFVNVCRGLSARRGLGGTTIQCDHHELSKNMKTKEDGDNTIGQLLLKLEMSGFYSD